jgi:hypothetical protein
LPDLKYWAATPLGQRKFLTREEFAAQHGAAQADLDKVAAFAQAHGLTVAESSAARRTVVLSGTVAQMEAAFGVSLGHYETPTESYRGREGFVHVPEEIAEIVESVLGLDNRPIARHHVACSGVLAPGAGPPGASPLTPVQVAGLYNFPNKSAAGVTIGIIELGGGYAQADINAFFTGLGLVAPTPTDVSVDGATNSPAGNINNVTLADPDLEVVLDIDVAGAVAQNAAIVMYFAPNTEQGFADAVKTAAQDTTNSPSILSISWSGSEDAWTSAGRTTMGKALVDAASLGVTVFLDSGDWGSDGNVGDGSAHVLYPTSDHGVTGCGGTYIANVKGSSFNEGTWNDSGDGATGGGISDVFGLPTWQEGIGVPVSANDGKTVGRGVPDIAGNASPYSGYTLTLYGQLTTNLTITSGPGAGGTFGTIGGTSAVAPLYAGLLAQIQAEFGHPFGFLNPVFYGLAGSSVFEDINDGVNNQWSQEAKTAPSYTSGPGWDACTGLGRIDGGALLNAFKQIYAKRCTFIINRDPLGQDEIDARRTQPHGSLGGLPIQDAFRVVVDGFTAAELGLTDSGSTLPNLPTVSPATGITISPSTPIANTPDNGGYGPEIQRFTFHYDIDFSDGTDPAFQFVGQTEDLTLSVTFASLPAASAQITLIKQPDPFLLHGDPAWLSIDLRVFVVRPNETWFGATMGPDASAAPGFIQQVMKNLTQGKGTAGGQSFDDPNVLSPDEDKSKLYLQPKDNNQALVFNFALAKVHYIGLIGAKQVRVFFRLRQTQVTYASFDYPPGAQYRRTTSTTNGQPIPLAGIQDNEYVTVPCFAEGRIDSTAQSMDQQTDDPNRQDFTAIGGPEVDNFFGCWIDINQPDKRLPVEVPPKQDGPFDVNDPNPNFQPVPLNKALARNLHLCLIAEINFDPTPIPLGKDPSNWDKLAQRNLAWSDTNPAQAVTTFEIRPTPSGLPAGQAPDELMIDWGNLPKGSSAQIYLPAVNVADILTMASLMYTSHRLGRIDNHTLRCETGGITYIPIPTGTGINFAGLLSVDLPATVQRGEVFNVVVRQVTNAFGKPTPPPPAPPRIEASPRKVTSVAPAEIEWRRVFGAFQLTIPVRAKEVLLLTEERDLSVLLWIAEAIPYHNRWYPVFQRYLEGIAGRVIAFGGDPTQILPSPTGDGRREPICYEVPERRLAFTGKISGLIFDRFGDFEGFLLDTEEGERKFFSREKEIKKLAESAWWERLRLTVWVECDELHRPLSIILRHPPAPFERLGD